MAAVLQFPSSQLDRRSGTREDRANLGGKMNRLSLIVAAMLMASCGQPSPKPPEQAAPIGPSSIQVEATPISPTVIKTIITTNLPLPVTVMASVDLPDQAGDDVYIGYSERVTLINPRTETLIDTSSGSTSSPANTPLPSGAYDLNVTFYPRWGAPDNPKAAALTSDVVGRTRVELGGSGASRETAQLMNDRRRWVMENVVVHTPFDETSFRRRLGDFEKSAATLNNHDAYYFPGADMTMIVNRTRRDVAIWRMGKASS